MAKTDPLEMIEHSLSAVDEGLSDYAQPFGHSDSTDALQKAVSGLHGAICYLLMEARYQRQRGNPHEFKEEE